MKRYSQATDVKICPGGRQPCSLVLRWSCFCQCAALELLIPLPPLSNVGITGMWHLVQQKAALRIEKGYKLKSVTYPELC